MFANLTALLRKGVIDNTSRGTIALTLWLANSEEPISLSLAGNCRQDIAGCRVEFSVPSPPRLKEVIKQKKDQLLSFCSQAEKMQAGDMTLSRRAPSLRRKGKVANLLSLELFYGAQARYLFETEVFAFQISLPAWECSSAGDSAQELLNMSLMRDYVHSYVEEFRGPGVEYARKDLPICHWDHTLNRAEAYMSATPMLLGKYADTPRGKLAEAFVLERDGFLSHIADEEETSGLPFAAAPGHTWIVLDFLEASAAEMVHQAMEHPLFMATGRLSTIIQKYILADMDYYQGNVGVEELLARYAGAISNILATILLAQDVPTSTSTVIARVKSLSRSMQDIRDLSASLKTGAQRHFLRGVDALIAELEHFILTLSH